MPATYEPISTQTLGSAASSITFSSIPGSYTDLRLVIVVRGATDDAYPVMRFNSDSGTNYSYTVIDGTGSSAVSYRAANRTNIGFCNNVVGSTTNPMLGTADIFSYAGSTNKTVLTTGSGDQNGLGDVERAVQLWRSTSAITSITVLYTGIGTNFAAGSTFTLYGIKAA